MYAIARTEKPRQYHYFDTPEGQDLDKKMLITLKYSALAGAALANGDVLLNSKPVGYANTLRRIGFMSLPVVGIAASFVITTNTLANIRGVDDCYNWSAGGALAGGLLGAWAKNPRVGWNAALFFALFATARKLHNEAGYIIIPDKTPARVGNATSPRYDWSLYKDEPAAWRKRFQEEHE